MRCLSCMTENPAGSRFCENCGGQFKLACRHCGHDCSPTAHFCGNCGQPLATASSGGSAGTDPKWGELKQATVLFADVVGSTEMIAGMDPEQAMGRLRPAILRMGASVERFGGTVVRTLGDGIMALFGVPQALEGHALLACEAALHMQMAFEGERGPLRIRVGLHSGQVASDPNDAQDGRGGGAHGLTIHLASRVVGLADPGGICITEACRASAGPACLARAMGAYPLKGIVGTTQIHALQGVALDKGPHAPGIKLSPFLGRQQELDRLLAAMDATQRGDARVLGVVGEPGAGKSRLCQEFAALCGGRGMQVHEVRVQLYGHAMPLQPVLELFRHHFFGIQAGEGAAAARTRIGQRMAPLALPASDMALLNEFLGVPEPDAAAVTLGSRARQARLLQLTAELVRLDAQQPRLIVIDDLHWLDEASEEFVSALVQAVPGTRTLLLLNYRPSYRSPWLQVAHHEQVALAELGQADMEALVAGLLAPLGAPPLVCALVVRRSGGNPFFAEELARSLIDNGLIAPGGALPEGGLEAVERALPATVQAVIGARLDRLGEPEKTLLQMCAIIGKEIPLGVLEHVASPLAGQIQKGLDGLCHAQLILPQPADSGRRFAFRHPMIQEVAYSTQLKVRRGVVHAAVAAAMEVYYREQLDEYAGLVAYHHEAAGQWLPAGRFSARAAAWVGSTHAAQAIKHWRKARTLVEPLPRTPEVDHLHVTAGVKIAWLGWREGITYDEAKPLIDEALAKVGQVDERLMSLLLLIEGRMFVASGGAADGYVKRVKRALPHVDAKKDGGRAAVMQAFLSQACAWAGLLNEALAANDAALAKAGQVDAFDREFLGFSVEHWALSVRSRLLVRMDRPQEARACLETLANLEATSTDSPLPGMASMGFVELAWALDDAQLAQQHAPELRRLAAKFDAPYLRIFLRGYEAVACMVSGEYAGAMDRFGEALQLTRKSRAANEFETEIVAGMAECQLRMGQHAQARGLASEAIELSLRRSTRVAHCRALIVRGAAAMALGGAGASSCEADFAQAEALVAMTGATSLRASLQHAREGLSYARAE